MDCFFSAQGYFECREKFENPYLCKKDVQYQNIGYKNARNCADVCESYSISTSCPYFSRNPISTISPCECGIMYKNVNYEKDPFSIALLKNGELYGGTRLIGGETIKQYNNITWNSCRSNMLKTFGEGMWMTYTDPKYIRVDVPNNTQPGTCVVHYKKS